MKEFEFGSKLMGTELNVSIISESKERATISFNKIYLKLLEYENTFSRFIEDSELVTLNKKKELNASKIFWEVFKESEKLYLMTGGKFNPLLNISKWGYDKDFQEIKDGIIKTGPLKMNLNFDDIEVVDEERKIILSENQSLDFGGFLKGYLAEKVSKELSKYFSGNIVNIGGDIFTSGRDESGEKFAFSIYNPVEDSYFSFIDVENSSISTSGNYKRKWMTRDGEVSHILKADGDNKIGENISITVIHRNGSMADALATVLISKRLSEIKILSHKMGFKYFLIKKDGRIVS